MGLLAAVSWGPFALAWEVVLRALSLSILAAVALLTAGAGCAHRAPGPTTPAAGSSTEFVVHVFNKSGTQTVPVAIFVDGVCVENREYAPFARTQDRGEIRLRLAPGVHTVRATVANVTRQTSVDRDHFMCHVIYYDETTDPKEQGGERAPRLTVEQIGWC